MLLNPLQHMRVAKRLRKKAAKLPEHMRTRALKLAGAHQGLARYQAKKLGNPHLPRKKAPWEQAGEGLGNEQQRPSLQLVSEQAPKSAGERACLLGSINNPSAPT